MIDSFRHQYFFLSNFYMRPMTYEGILYPSSEHAFQAAKSLDLEVRKQIAALPKAGDSKKQGYKILLRPDWEQPGKREGLPVKYDIMFDVVEAKFKQNPDLIKRLLATGNEELIEGNNWDDHIWGVCNGTGTNYLGKILMEVRQNLQ